jgi:hypothetical protein
VTFKNLQDRVMDRYNLTSSDARTRIKNHLNERYRALVTSVSLGRVRRTPGIALNTVNGTATYTPTNVVKVIQIAYPAGNKVLDERTEDFIRESDPDLSQTGAPDCYVQQKFTATGVTVRIYPTPDAVYALTVDGIVSGTDMSVDGDVPAFPEDFHDILIFGALEEEAMKLEKNKDAPVWEKKAKTRTSELRYFLAKSGYLHKQQGAQFWWWGPHPGRPFGW